MSDPSGALLRVLAGAAVLAAGAAAQTPVVTTVLQNGSTANCYDLVILGDGYTAAEQGRFDSDVNTFLTGLFQKEPYATFGSYFNVHTVFRASAQSGASHPDANPPIVVNNAYGSSYNTGGTGRCLYIQDTSLASMDAALAPANESRVLVLVNDSRYGGCAAQFAVSYNGANMVEVQSHEMGHALAQLADEYDYPNGHYSGSEPSRVNITTSPTGQKWSHWWGVQGTSAFEGAGYYQTGLWRPKQSCLMRSLGVANCPVCREQVTRRVNATVDVITATSPADGVTITRPATQLFSMTHMVPPQHNPTIAWQLDGQPVAGASGTSLLLDSAALTVGSHTLTVTVTDPMPFVRVDPSQTMVEEHTWRVTAVDPNSVDLSLSGVAATPQTAHAGLEVDVVATLTNSGPGTANGVTVEHFLSTDGILDGSDLSLGRAEFASVAPGQTPVLRRVRLPALLPPRLYLLIGVVDRGDSVAELNETNNVNFGVLTAGTAPCQLTLEYRDPQLYPRDHAELPLATGGAVHPTVIADCAAPGTLYVIAWGCSGTVPGTPLSPTVTAPLNTDACTDIGLAAANGPEFQQFWGTLDGAGIGRATLQWPPSPSLQGVQSHFAAVLLDPSSASFVAATNAISFQVN